MVSTGCKIGFSLATVVVMIAGSLFTWAYATGNGDGFLTVGVLYLVISCLFMLPMTLAICFFYKDEPTQEVESGNLDEEQSDDSLTLNLVISCPQDFKSDCLDQGFFQVFFVDETGKMGSIGQPSQ